MLLGLTADGLGYTTVIEFAKPPAGQRGSALER
jgi:hypothetical protein